MDMSGLSANLPDRTFEEGLRQCWEDLEKRNLTTPCAQGAAPEPASMFLPSQYPHSRNEAPPILHQRRGLHGNAPRVTKIKIGPRPGAGGKVRQQRQTCKGIFKVHLVDPSSFKALVYEYTSQRSPSPPPDVAAPPTSPLTPPQNIRSTSSSRSFMSQPSSPVTPHSVRTSCPSPLSSPQQGRPDGGLYVSGFHLPLRAHEEQSPQVYAPYPHPLLCNGNQNLIPNHNPNLHQSTSVPGCAATSWPGMSSEDNNVDNGQREGVNPAQYASLSSLKGFLAG